ncbi:EAL domain-containing protein [Xylophilus sp. GOD-11R]|uniref:EAL domain-containing protein n=1 Tax=Xylophilus sp. GOD-11R TaxID=3089814 RepID=UPI00298C9299|nr:EAL domain-containing protein [Xylophilus sp. GOD-11R]WPB57458.1 EAL domain-containing protein [Xylophilus sp. GOD-11R]
MAFQPVVHLPSRSIYAHEALVRGPAGESAYSILSQVSQDNRYAFDQACRVKAIELAARLGMRSRLSINFLPNAVYRAEACIKLTLATAEKYGFPVQNIIFELTEDERSRDLPHLESIFTEYRRRGFITAIDDFGAGYAGFEFLAAFQPDVIKLDMGLVRGVHEHRAKRAIVSGMMAICRELGIRVVGEGVETREELRTLADLGVEYFQGYLFAKPALEQMPGVDWSGADLAEGSAVA